MRWRVSEHSLPGAGMISVPISMGAAAQMKTTIELPDELLMLAKRRALERGTTLKALIEAGLQHALNQETQRDAQPYRFPVIHDALRQAMPGDDDVNALINCGLPTGIFPASRACAPAIR